MNRTSTPTVWVVDDGEEDQEFIIAAFRSVHPTIRIQLFNDGHHVVNQLAKRASPPQLILLDINMPLVNGYETLIALMSKPSFDQVPVIMLTTSSEAADQERSLGLMATHFLTKPVSFEELKRLIQ